MARQTKQERIDELNAQLVKAKRDVQVLASNLDYVTEERDKWIKKCGVLEQLLSQSDEE